MPGTALHLSLDRSNLVTTTVGARMPHVANIKEELVRKQYVRTPAS
jgi:hypothetical protein